MKFKNKILKFFSSSSNKGESKYPQDKIQQYFKNGRVPWSDGYAEFKKAEIERLINSDQVLTSFKNKKLDSKFGYRIDERIVEYPWIFSNLLTDKTELLDAGSTFNYPYIVKNQLIEKKSLTIFTYFPENNCFHKKRISYVFGDLRNMYFKDSCFDEIVCQSTIEHIDMDNSIYGYETEKSEQKSFEYLKAIKELIRVLKPGGTLLLTFPFGKYEYHGSFQQFDSEMLQRALESFSADGNATVTFFKYEIDGWRFAEKDELKDNVSFNPHTGKGKGDDGAAHCRSVACIRFLKSNL